MPKLLYLAYYFPPSPCVASVRSWNTAIQLSRQGWEITVVTPDSSLWRRADSAEHVREVAEQEGLQVIRTGHSWRLLNNAHLQTSDSLVSWLVGGSTRRAARFFDVAPESGWNRAVLGACHGLRDGDVDVILATGIPFGAFQLARQLSQRLRCPYVCDYRDGWTAGNMRPGPRRRWSVALEQEVLQDTAAAICVTPSNAQELAAKFSVGEKLHLIWNGFDPEHLAQVQSHEFDHFAIVYAGALFPPRRDLRQVIEAFGQLKRSGRQDLPDWRFHFYGHQTAYVRALGEEFSVADRIELHGRVPRQEVLEATKGAGMVIVSASTAEECTPEDRGIVTGKIFEPLGLRRPVLVIAPPKSDLELVLATAGLGKRFAGSQVSAMAEYLADAMKGEVPPPKDPDAFSWPVLGQQVDEVLRGAIDASREEFHRNEGCAGV